MIAGDVMDSSAALLNDVSRTNFTYAKQIPYLNMAINELLETMQLNNVPGTNKKSAILVVTTSMTDIGGVTGPALPTDLVEIRGCYERLSGSNEDFQLMTRRDFLPPYIQVTDALIYWAWQQQVINFLGATSTREVRLDYVAAVIAQIVAETDTISTIESKTFLSYRNAALCAEFIGENPERASTLNAYASLAMDRFLGINTKGRQSIATRRRPFMANYKVRSGY